MAGRHGWVLAAVGLGPGMSCLDVRSGPGAVMRLMADRVGPQGLVTGIEIDLVLGAEALRDLRTQRARTFSRSPPTSSPSADASWRALRSDLLPASPHACGTPSSSSRRWRHGPSLAAWWWRRSSISAPSPSSRLAPSWASSTACSRACSGGHGRNMRAGRQLPAQFEAAGLGTPDGTDAAVHYLPLSHMANMLIGVYESSMPQAPSSALPIRCGLPSSAKTWRRPGQTGGITA